VKNLTLEQVTLLGKTNKEIPDAFLDWLTDNFHIWKAFERESLAVINAGFKHYSARTILEFLRHHTALTEKNGAFKIRNNSTPYLARLFALVYPEHAELFRFNQVFIAKNDAAGFVRRSL
jgi:hypothetical protein